MWCLIVGMIVGGCGKSDSNLAAQRAAGLPPEALSVRDAFAGSGPSYENPVNEILKLIKAGEQNPAAYAEALPQLQRLASNPTISAQQKQALDALVEKLRAAASNPIRR